MKVSRCEKLVSLYVLLSNSCVNHREGGQRVRTPPGKSQVVKGFVRDSGTERVDRGSGPHLENHKWLKVSLGIVAQTPRKAETV